MIETLIIGTSPLQFQNAIQYLRQCGLDPSRAAAIQVESHDDASNEMTRAVLAQLPWGAVRAIPPYVSVPKTTPLPRSWWRRRLLRGRKRAQIDPERWAQLEIASRQAFIDLVRACVADIEVAALTRVVLGDYRPASFRQFLQFVDMKRVETVLVDDGSVARYVMAVRGGRKKADEVTRRMPPDLGPADPFIIVEPEKLTYFTIYEQDVPSTDRIVLNDKYTTDPARARVDEVWICGANHVEAGLARRREYISAVRKVSAWFPGMKIVYFPHRRENQRKLDEIVKRTAIEVRSTSRGIEDYVLDESVEPRVVLSFGSTVVDTLTRMFAPRQKLFVVVPGARYFTADRRTQHVKNVIHDNVRENPYVLGVPVGVPGMGVHLLARAEMRDRDATSRGEVPLGDLFDPAEPVCGARQVGLTRATSEADEWVRFRETATGGAHRVDLATFDPAVSLAHMHVFRFRSEGRSRITLQIGSGPDPGLAVQFDADRPGWFRTASDLGMLAVAVDVDAQRIATVSAYVGIRTGEPVTLLLATLSPRAGERTDHPGNPASGFALAPPSATRGRPEPVIDPESSRRASLVDLQLSRIQPVALHGENDSTLIVVHDGSLNGLRAEAAHAAQLRGSEKVQLLALHRGPKDRMLRATLKQVRLIGTAPLTISAAEGGLKLRVGRSGGAARVPVLADTHVVAVAANSDGTTRIHGVVSSLDDGPADYFFAV